MSYKDEGYSSPDSVLAPTLDRQFMPEGKQAPGSRSAPGEDEELQCAPTKIAAHCERCAEADRVVHTVQKAWVTSERYITELTEANASLRKVVAKQAEVICKLESHVEKLTSDKAQLQWHDGELRQEARPPMSPQDTRRALTLLSELDAFLGSPTQSEHGATLVAPETKDARTPTVAFDESAPGPLFSAASRSPSGHRRHRRRSRSASSERYEYIIQCSGSPPRSEPSNDAELERRRRMLLQSLQTLAGAADARRLEAPHLHPAHPPKGTARCAQEARPHHVMRESPPVTCERLAVPEEATPARWMASTATGDTSEACAATKPFSATPFVSDRPGFWTDPMWSNVRGEAHEAHTRGFRTAHVATRLFRSTSVPSLARGRARSASPPPYDRSRERTARWGATASYRSTSPRFGNAVDHARLGAKANENPHLDASLHAQPGVGDYDHARCDVRGNRWLSPEPRRAGSSGGW